MPTLPQEILRAWENRNGPIVLTTVDQQGTPNSIYATCVAAFNDNQIVVADNYFNKTRNNILNGSRASILFITGEGKSYQLKGSIQYHISGEVFDDMKQWNPQKHPGHAAAALHIEAIFSGAEKIL